MSANRYFDPLDRLIVGADKALRVIAGVASASRRRRPRTRPMRH
jgi:ubiquinone biosynthesis monooxygenase Coq7